MRVELETDVDAFEKLKPGDYGKTAAGTWWLRFPTPEDGTKWPPARLGGHKVVEHGDGTITVTPSILWKLGDGREWHGWLTKGIWKKLPN